MRRALLTCLLAAVAAAPLVAQAADEGTFSVRRAGGETGRETFRLAPQPGQAGSTLTARAQFPSISPRRTVTMTLDLDPGGAASQFDYEATDAGGTLRVLGAAAGPRFTVRVAGRGREAAREVPAGPGTLVLDPDVVATLLVLGAGEAQGTTTHTAILPATGRRLTFRATREADGPRRRVTLAGDLTGTLQFDAAGHLVRAEIPTWDLEAVRLTN